MCKSSEIWSLNKEEFQSLVYDCNSLAEILRKLGLYVSSGNYRPLKARLDDEGIDYSHIKLGLSANRGKKFPNKRIPIKELLQKGTTITSSGLKKKLLDENMLENKCNKCGIGPEWCNDKLVLQLDHINGDSRDNRLENLRILCPNCHSQTNTYAAKNKTTIKKIKLCKCGNIISRKSTRCRKCAAYLKQKIDWPTKEELLAMLKTSNYTQLAKILGVSDNALRKRLKENL